MKDYHYKQLEMAVKDADNGSHVIILALSYFKECRRFIGMRCNNQTNITLVDGGSMYVPNEGIYKVYTIGDMKPIESNQKGDHHYAK